MKAPVIFLAHGAPILTDDPVWPGELHAWARALPRPSAILMISAHWERAPLTIGATAPVPLVYDFGGFPDRYYRVTYPAPGAPALARRVTELLPGHAIAHAPGRGLDHGAYVPLLCMYPDADVPVLQLSLPTLEPRALWELGRALAPLRDEGVLIVGSGFLTHSFRGLDPARAAEAPPAYVAEFDAWCADTLARRDVDALLDYRKRGGRSARWSLPTVEHFVPLIVAAGVAAGAAADAVSFPITGTWYGNSKRSVQFG